VFSFANRSRHADVLDQQCIDAAVHAALDSELPRDSLLLINTEPAVAHVPRADGIAIAVDDVGAHPDSLAVLDIIDPDIIKLDMTMIQNCTMRNKADALTGVLAHHERTGALIIAEGVETDGRRRRRSSLCSAATCPPTSAEGAQRRAATRRSAVPGVGRRRAWRGYV
jgi:predicted signal transduction protein with EAL and GGDEF domain